ncbi:MAG: ArsR family transcriptional regulator [Deltaproteobacteria bacterium]|nr:ArsR family transcriptional regulator [Deltaproteobacteria bacterium]
MHNRDHGHGDPPLAPLGEQTRAVLDTIGDLMAFWGFQRSHGRIWALLFLAERPPHAGEVAEILDLSAGQVSMSLRDLEHWGVVHAERHAGQRRTVFAAETNIFKMVARVFRERELDQVRRLARVLLAARDELERTPESPGAAVRLRRVRALIAAAELGRTLIEWLVEGKLLPGWVQSGLDRQLDDK